MNRRDFLKTTSGLFVPMAPALILPKQVLAQSPVLPGPGLPVSSALPGPPVFTFTDIQSGTLSTNTATSNSLAIGAANSNRRVYVLAIEASTGTGLATAASFNSGAISADVLQTIGTTATDGMNVYLVSAVVPTGTTCTVTLTYPGITSGTPRYGAYTVDTTTLVSKNPVVAAQNVITSGLANPSTTNTFGIAVATAGSAILAGGFFGFGGSVGGQTFSSSDASVSKDGTFGGQMVGHANSAPVSASSRVNTTWTGTPGDSILALAVLR